MSKTVTNIIFAGIGGQGVLTASDILTEVAFRSGLDVKKSEIHGMSQRGGSVSSDVRFGSDVLSPMVPDGQADFLVVLDDTQIENNRHMLVDGGVLIEPSCLDIDRLPSRKSLNVALLGVLSESLEIDEAIWLEVIHSSLAEKLHEMNDVAFAIGREAGRDAK